MIVFADLHDHAIHWPSLVEQHDAGDWVEQLACCGWHGGYMMVDGTLVPLYAKPLHYGVQFFDCKQNYSLGVQVCYSFMLWICVHLGCSSSVFQIWRPLIMFLSQVCIKFIHSFGTLIETFLLIGLHLIWASCWCSQRLVSVPQGPASKHQNLK